MSLFLLLGFLVMGAKFRSLKPSSREAEECPKAERSLSVILDLREAEELFWEQRRDEVGSRDSQIVILSFGWIKQRMRSKAVPRVRSTDKIWQLLWLGVSAPLRFRLPLRTPPDKPSSIVGGGIFMRLQRFPWLETTGLCSAEGHREHCT